MGDGFVQVAPDSTGKKLDTTEIVVGANTVERERVQIGGATGAELADTRNTTPGAGDYGLVTRNIPSGTQPTSAADGQQVTLGALADAAVSTDANGTVNAHLRGIVKLLAAALDVSDRVARLLGHVSLDSGGTLKGQATMANSLPVVVASDQTTVPISAASLPLPTGAATEATLVGRLKPADTLTAVTTVGTITNPVTANGDVDHDAVNTLKNIQIAGNASPVKTTPAAISATGDRVRAWFDQYGRMIFGARKLATYSAVYRLAVTNAEADLTFTHVANTDKQYATISHAATAVKLVKIKRVEIWIDNVATAAGIFFIELRRLSTTAPATGNPVITPLAFNSVDGAAETTCLALPTTAGSEAAANSPVASIRLDLGLTAAAPTTNPVKQDDALVLWEEPDWLAENDFLTIRNGVAEGYAIIVRSSAVSVTRFKVRIIFTEETP